MRAPVALVFVALGCCQLAEAPLARSQAGQVAFSEERFQALVGQTVRVCGEVIEYSCQAAHDSQLDLASHPTEPGVSVRLPVSSRPRFGLDFEGRVFGRQVCATGPISRVGKRFLVEVDDPAELSFTPGGATPAEPQGLVSPCDLDVTMPVLRREEKPVYTVAALQARLQGTVWLDTVIGIDGKPGLIRIVRSLDPRYGLDREAVNALERWRFTPARHAGQPAPVRIVVEMSFTLKP